MSSDVELLLVLSTSLDVCDTDGADLTGSTLLNLIAEVNKERASGRDEVYWVLVKPVLVEMALGSIGCVEDRAARDIDQVEPSAVLSSGARAQVRMPTKAVAVGHMMASRSV